MCQVKRLCANTKAGLVSHTFNLTSVTMYVTSNNEHENICSRTLLRRAKNSQNNDFDFARLKCYSIIQNTIKIDLHVLQRWAWLIGQSNLQIYILELAICTCQLKNTRTYCNPINIRAHLIFTLSAERVDTWTLNL